MTEGSITEALFHQLEIGQPEGMDFGQYRKSLKPSCLMQLLAAEICQVTEPFPASVLFCVFILTWRESMYHI